MNENKTGNLIKKLREKNNMTQEELAALLFVTRQVISNIELGKTRPSQSNIEKLSKIFNVASFEIYTGEEINIESKELVDSTINKITTSFSTKLKKTIIIFSLIILIIISGFFAYYFFHSYNSVKIYNIYLENKNYKVNNGLLILTKDYINFTLDLDNQNNNEIKEVILHYKINKEDKIIVKTDDLDLNLIDIYGYEAYFNYDNLIQNIGIFYLEIIDTDNKTDLLELKLDKVYENKKLIFNKNKKMITSTKYEYSDKNIPEKIQSSFNNENDSFTLNVEKSKYKAQLTYLVENNQFIAIEEYKNYFINWLYDIDLQIISYSKYNEANNILEEFSIDITNIKANEKELYNYFYQNYIVEYLK